MTDYINDAKKRADDSGYFVTDYIKRKDAINTAYPFDDSERNLQDALEGIPSADVVEVVRCKDCVMCVEYMGNMFCGYQSFFSNPAGVSANDYCSRGERAEA